MDLDRGVDHLLRRLGGVELGHGGGAAIVAIALVLLPRGAGDEQGGGVDRGRHVGEIGLGDGIVGQRAIAELARGRKGDRLVERAAGETERGGGDGDAEQGEGLHRDLEALAGIAEHGGGGKADVGQLEAGERVRGDGLDPFGDFETRGVAGEDEGRNAARALQPRRCARKG